MQCSAWSAHRVGGTHSADGCCTRCASALQGAFRTWLAFETSCACIDWHAPFCSCCPSATQFCASALPRARLVSARTQPAVRPDVQLRRRGRTCGLEAGRGKQRQAHERAAQARRAGHHPADPGTLASNSLRARRGSEAGAGEHQNRTLALLACPRLNPQGTPNPIGLRGSPQQAWTQPQALPELRDPCSLHARPRAEHAVCMRFRASPARTVRGAALGA